MGHPGQNSMSEGQPEIGRGLRITLQRERGLRNQALHSSLEVGEWVVEGLSEKWGESGSGKDCFFLPSWKTHFKAQVVVEGTTCPGLTQWPWEEAGRRARGPLPCAQPPVTLAPHHTVAPAALELPPSPPGLPSPRLAVTASRKASRPAARFLDHHPLEEYFGAPLSLGWEHSGAELL